MNKEIFIKRNRSEYGDVYDQFNWVSNEQAAKATGKRTQLLAQATAAGASWGSNFTKIDSCDLSPGCRCCAEGTWSCIFITGLCNTRCFYCPSPQNDPSLPTTNTLEFPLVGDYIEYLEFFGFKGVGISGGEPLLNPQRTMEFLTGIKNHFGDRMHTWLYSNGTKATSELLAELGQAGLDEIRFDIGAQDYSLEAVKRAIPHIPIVTVEIPAIPGDIEKMKEKIREMKAAGVRYLNLHQLRCTPYNFRNLIDRGYTFLHGPKVTVLESELAALELLNYTLSEGIELPINYCSFIYKNKFQAASARRRHGNVIKKAWEDLTPAGLVRRMAIKGDKKALVELVATLKAREKNSKEETWQLDTTRSCLYIGAAFQDLIEPGRFSLAVSYYISSIRPTLSYLNAFQEIALNSGKRFVIEREPAFPAFELQSKEEIEAYKKLFLVPQITPGISLSPAEERKLLDALPPARVSDLWECERLQQGLMEYY